MQQSFNWDERIWSYAFDERENIYNHQGNEWLNFGLTWTLEQELRKWKADSSMDSLDSSDTLTSVPSAEWEQLYCMSK